MSTLTTPTVPPRLLQALAATLEAGARRVARLVEAWRHRHDAAVLAGLDDRMLADLGLSRTDLNDALSEPLWRDPTALLARRHRERRRSRGLAIAALNGQAAPSLVPGSDAFLFPPGDPPARLTL